MKPLPPLPAVPALPLTVVSDLLLEHPFNGESKAPRASTVQHNVFFSMIGDNPRGLDDARTARAAASVHTIPLVSAPAMHDDARRAHCLNSNAILQCERPREFPKHSCISQR